MKKYLYSCTYSWMCRSFDGFYFAPTKKMEVSHKTVAFASLLIFRPDTVKNSCSSSKMKNKKTPLLFVFVVLFIASCCKSPTYPIAAKTLWICSILHNSIDLLPNEYKSFFPTIVPNPKTGSLVLMRSTSSAVSKLQTLMVQSLDPDMMYVPNG